MAAPKNQELYDFAVATARRAGALADQLDPDRAGKGEIVKALDGLTLAAARLRRLTHAAGARR